MMQTESEDIEGCPACGSNTIDETIEAVDGVCERCGLVVREGIDSASFEWEVRESAFGDTNDKGWTSECAVRNGTEQQLARAFEALEEVANRIHLPEGVREETAELYCDAFRVELTDGRDTSCLIAGCLHLVSRDMGTPIPMSCLTELSAIEQKKFRRAYSALCDEFGNGLPRPEPVAYLLFLKSELDLEDTNWSQTKQLLEEAEGDQAFVGKDPAGIAAGAVYLTQEQVTQSKAADAVGLSTETIRKRSKQLQVVLGHD